MPEGRNHYFCEANNQFQAQPTVHDVCFIEPSYRRKGMTFSYEGFEPSYSHALLSHFVDGGI